MTHNASQRPEPDNDIYKVLLESTKAIPWQIDWKTMQFTYIGPQIEALLGWSQDSWVSANDWAARIHAEDRDQVVNFCISQAKVGVDHEADYRALTKDGQYVWIRDVVHVVREQGEVVSLIGFMFDIAERKQREEAVLKLQRELEELSFKDGLTSVANRRMFEQTFEREWASSRRYQEPLSLILVDIDFFKNYNDCYGHLKGDDCLKNIAGLLAMVATRPRDLVARFGGEEFALILPNTDALSAMAMAENCRRVVREAAIPHERSSVGAYVSVSAGVSTLIPSHDDTIEAFTDSVDRLLYQAKQRGRDRVGDVRIENGAAELT